MLLRSIGKVGNRQFRSGLQSHESGFTFVGLLVVVTILGIVLLSVGEVWSFAKKREKEQALLFVGGQFQQAIKLYYLHTPAANKLKPYPNTLDELLKDPRFPSTQRYLRKIYPDPITNSPDWGLLRNQYGGIVGVYSLSEEKPIKQANFKLVYDDFKGKTKYSDWVFKYAPAQNQVAPAQNALPPGQNTLTPGQSPNIHLRPK
jgi:type II secretory pathway pseudopilin PulG